MSFKGSFGVSRVCGDSRATNLVHVKSNFPTTRSPSSLQNTTPRRCCTSSLSAMYKGIVQRRRSARIPTTPATTSTVTLSSTASPVLSNQPSIEPETPATSDVEEVKNKGAVLVIRNTRKRAADAELEVTTKRRAVSSSVYVQIPERNNTASSKVRPGFNVLRCYD